MFPICSQGKVLWSSILFVTCKTQITLKFQLVLWTGNCQILLISWTSCLNPCLSGKLEWKVTCPTVKPTCHGWADGPFFKPLIVVRLLLFWLQMCVEKETSWQAKEGAVMCKPLILQKKKLTLYTFLSFLTLHSLHWETDHPSFIFTTFLPYW